MKINKNMQIELILIKELKKINFNKELKKLMNNKMLKKILKVQHKIKEKQIILQ